MGVGEFNTLLIEFLDELSQVFPENSELVAYKNITQQIVESQPSTPSQMFLTATAPHALKIVNRDPTFFDDCPKLLKVDIKQLWSKNISDGTRDVIWMYLTELHALAATSVLPSNTVDKLTEVAKDVTAQIQAGTLDPTQFFKMLGMTTPGQLFTSK